MYIALHKHFQLVIKDGFKQAGSINNRKSIHVAEVLESKRSV